MINSINLNILECKDFLVRQTFYYITGINLNILECKVFYNW